MNEEEKKLIKKLNKIGVDTRYISLYEDKIYINNLKFSKFSRKKEEKFHEEYPEIDVIRSTLLQKICVKASRTLKNQIKPRENIYIEDDNTPENIVMYIILEPYQRKYGITITNTQKINQKTANPKTLNEFIKEYITQMTQAEQIRNTYQENHIYPLEHIDERWITDWIESTDIKYTTKKEEDNEKINQIIEFLEEKIPNTKESIFQSVKYIEENSKE